MKYRFSLLHELNGEGRFDYRECDGDAQAMKHAAAILGDYDKVTVYEGVRVVGLVLHPRNRIRG